MSDRIFSRNLSVFAFLSTKYLTSTIARDLRSLEAISFGIGRAFNYPFHYRVKVGDGFANAQNDTKVTML
jgi:hypothetical protein